jgi:excisionase family DNA binding protein
MRHQVVSEKLTKKQAAERLNCSTGHIDNLIAEGRLAAAKIGRLVRIDSVDVERLFDSNRIDRGARPDILCQR